MQNKKGGCGCGAAPMPVRAPARAGVQARSPQVPTALPIPAQNRNQRPLSAYQQGGIGRILG